MTAKRSPRNKKNDSNSTNRLNILLGFFILVCAVFVVRLFSIQVLQHEHYKALAQDQYWNLQHLPAKRGDILTSDGFPLATTELSYLLYIEPKKIEDKAFFVNELSKSLAEISTQNLEEDSKEDYSSKLSFYQNRLENLLELDLFWIAVEHNLTPFSKEFIESKNLEGVGFEEQPMRYYPENNLAAHVLGFVASDEFGNTVGYFGVEGNLDGDLKGKPGRIIEERDAVGAPILVGGHKRVDPIDGRDIILTIDRSTQYIVESKLKEGVEKYGAYSGTVIVMDPFTGDILALANYPTYDPANFNETYVEEEALESTSSYSPNRTNYAIAEVYEPGSVIKALTVASGIDSGKITPNSTFIDSGPVSYSGYTIDNWDGKHHGPQTVVELLQKSNNIGSAWVGHLVGAKDLHAYFKKFGYGNTLGIELEGEDTGYIRPANEWTDIDLATAAFGQGISATPLQVINSFNVIANGGVLMRPRIVKQINEDGKQLTIPPKELQRVISEESAKTVSDMLVKAVEGGESKFFNIKNYKIAGKTGTAQIPKGGKYDPNETNATFVGYLDTSKQYSMIVRLDRPQTSVYAAETAVPLWMDITRELVTLYQIPPDF